MTQPTQPNITHAWEQFRAFSNDLAKTAWSYYRQLLSEGFSPDAALVLTRAWQDMFIRSCLFRGGEGGK